MYGLTLVGDARPIAADRLDGALGAKRALVPEPLVRIYTTWGAGWLCGVFELPDPSELDGRFEYFQHKLRIQGIALRRSGYWAQLAEDELAGGLVLGIDRRGAALFARAATQLLLLHPDGELQPLGSFDAMMAKYLLSIGRESLSREDAPWDEDRDLGIPAAYLTAFRSERPAFFEALAAGDEAAADAALPDILATEVAVYALLELATELAGPAGARFPADLRAAYVEQCLRMAKRRAPGIVKDAPLRDVRQVLASGAELPSELLGKLAALLPAPRGIFLGTADPTEVALLDALAEAPHDAATRLVYADHLEQRGELDRAAELRSDLAVVAPLPDARERGFVAPPNFPPVDAIAQIREHAVRWQLDDPDTSIADLLARVDALHPTARQGYALLLAQFGGWRLGADAFAHLRREIRDAWPQLVLAIRSDRAPYAVQLLVDGKVLEAAPYLLSAIRRPSEYHAELLAGAYVALAKVAPALVDEFLPYFEPEAATPALRAAAFILLRDSGANDRVFDAYLRHFCDAHPHSEHALKKRRKDPRVAAALLEALAREEKASLRDGRHLAYTANYGKLAKYLARLGNPRGKEAAKNYARFTRWGQGSYERDL